MNGIETGLLVTVVGMLGAFVAYVFKAGSDHGKLAEQVKKLSDDHVKVTEELDDMDVRMRSVEQLLPAIATRLESHADLVSEVKSDMKAGFARLEALLGTFFKGNQ